MWCTDMLIPVDEEKDVYLLLGILLTLRHIIPHLSEKEGQSQGKKVKDTSAQGQKPTIEAKIEVEQLVQVCFQTITASLIFTVQI